MIDCWFKPTILKRNDACWVDIFLNIHPTLEIFVNMIFSRYSEIIEGKDKCTYLFSCLNRKWIKFDDQLAEIFIERKDDLSQLENLHPALFEVLVKEGFVVASPEEDIKRGVDYVVGNYFSADNVMITINPTLDCNLRCWYCYESRNSKSVMSNEIIENTINYIKSLLETYEIKTLRLSFFGGEPLMYFKQVISPILKNVRHLCSESKTHLSISITTNGVLINKDFFYELKRFAKDTYIQVAFDGNREEHNKVKFLGKGFGCYDRTIRNVKDLIKEGFNVTVRCNYGKKTISSFLDVVSEFREYHTFPNLRFLFQRIWQEPEDDEMMELRKELKKSIDDNYKINSNLHNLLGNSLQRCYADKSHNIVINYDGLIFKCTARNFDKENSIGSLKGSKCVFTNVAENNDTLLGTPYGKHCEKCRILPICPNCSQIKKEHGFDSCPINVSDKNMTKNIKAAFHDLSGVDVRL